ncbi:MAG TPA: hypothetical protein VHR66_29660 [Gemmataceae bacterium]|jgi:Flp pilus assembly protein TadD|nr:hypothetical protein [Gemmataceae bacterium]
MSDSRWPKAIPLLILCGLCAYANCYSKSFAFDDDAWIVDTPSLDSPREYFLAMDGRPLLAATNLVAHRLGRNNALAHHVLNVLIHLAATLTLYGVVRRALLSQRFGERFAGRAPHLACAVALLWMLHPLQVQCVTYIIQRGESMAGLFYLFILYAMQRADEAARARVGRTQEEIDYADSDGSRGAHLINIRWPAVGWYTLSVLSLILGFGSKEIMATAPGAVILFDRIFLAGSIREMIRRRWAFYLAFLLVWGGFTVWHLIRGSGSQGGIGFGVEAVTPRQYALTESGVMLYYLRLCLWPRGLVIDYQGWPFVKTIGEATPEIWITLGLLALTAILLFWRPALGFVCAWFFLILLPTSSVLPIVDAVFEHRLYLSLASVVVLVVFLGDWFLRIVALGRLRPVLLTAVAIALGILTFARNEEYRSRADVWQSAVERMPNSVRARANFAQGLIIDNRNDEVIPILDRALELAPLDTTSLQNQGCAYEMLGDYRTAAEYYGRLANAYPSEVRYWRLYGAVLLVIREWEKADAAYKKAAELSDNEAEHHYARAVALLKLGRDAEADTELGKASAISASWPELVLGMARNVILEERLRAIPDARQSALNWAQLGMRVIKDPEPIHFDSLGLCYAATGDFAKAAEQSHMALLIAPKGPWAAVHRDRLRYYDQKRVPWE